MKSVLAGDWRTTCQPRERRGEDQADAGGSRGTRTTCGASVSPVRCVRHLRGSLGLGVWKGQNYAKGKRFILEVRKTLAQGSEIGDEEGLESRKRQAFRLWSGSNACAGTMGFVGGGAGTVWEASVSALQNTKHLRRGIEEDVLFVYDVEKNSLIGSSGGRL